MSGVFQCVFFDLGDIFWCVVSLKTSNSEFSNNAVQAYNVTYIKVKPLRKGEQTPHRAIKSGYH